MQYQSFVLLLCLAACNSSAPETGPDADACSIDVVLSGQINDHVTGRQYCEASGTFVSPAQRAKSSMSGPHGEFHIELLNVAEGQTGKVKATLSIVKQPGGGGWATPLAACDIDITEWRLIDDKTPGFWEYRYLGAGTCQDAAAAFGGQTGEVQFAPFTLKNWLLWAH